MINHDLILDRDLKDICLKYIGAYQYDNFPKDPIIGDVISIIVPEEDDINPNRDSFKLPYSNGDIFIYTPIGWINLDMGKELEPIEEQLFNIKKRRE